MSTSPPVVDLLFELLRFDTQNPPGNTTSIVNWLEAYFESLGLRTEQVASDRNKPNLLATLPGKTDRTLLYAGHLDTVPFDATAWQYDPLGEQHGEWIYGRGATDMKGAVASMLQTARTFVETESTPPMTIQFAFVSDEETGGEAGMATLLDATHLATEVDACVIGETTSTPNQGAIAVADRGHIWLTLHAEGSAAHGSRPMAGENAIDRLWAAIETIKRILNRRLSIEPAVRSIVAESVEHYTPMMGAETAHDLFAYPTVSLGVLEGGTAVNTVPDSATAQLDVRLTAGVYTPDVLDAIRISLERHERVSIVASPWCIGTYERLDNPLVAAATHVVQDVTGEQIARRSAIGGGDARHTRTAGIPTIEFAVGSDTLHGVDEYTTVTALRQNCLVYSRLPYAFSHQLNQGEGSGRRASPSRRNRDPVRGRRVRQDSRQYL